MKLNEKFRSEALASGRPQQSLTINTLITANFQTLQHMEDEGRTIPGIDSAKFPSIPCGLMHYLKSIKFCSFPSTSRVYYQIGITQREA